MAQTARTRVIDVPVYDEGLRRYLSNIFLTMTFGLIVTGVVSQIVLNSPDLLSWFVEKNTKGEQSLTWWWWGLSFAEFSIVGWISNRSEDATLTLGRGLGMFAIYSAFNGLTIAPVLDLYTSVSVLKVFLITASVFSACAIYGHTTKRDLTGFGVFMVMGLFGLLIAMVVNIFLRSPAMDFLVSVAGVLIFTGLTAWDMQKLREMYDEDGSTVGLVINGALAFYLDFMNLFLFFLRWFGDSDEKSDSDD